MNYLQLLPTYNTYWLLTCQTDMCEWQNYCCKTPVDWTVCNTRKV